MILENAKQTITKKDIFKPNKYHKNWISIKLSDNAFLDMAQSKFDKRDFIVSYHTPYCGALNQDNFVTTFSVLTTSAKERRQRFIEKAQEIIEKGFIA